MRSLMVNVLGEDYIMFAESKGLKPRRIFLRYGMRNALLPQVTALALALGTVVSGAVLVEAIFNYPGLGGLLFSAILGKDIFVIQGIVLMLIVTLAVAVFIIDLIYPRPGPEDPTPHDDDRRRRLVLPAAKPRRRRSGSCATRASRRQLIVGVLMLIAIVVFAIVGPMLVDPKQAIVGATVPRAAADAQHFLGTDTQGRDIWTVMALGAPNTLKIGLIAGFVGVGDRAGAGADRRLLRRPARRDHPGHLATR